MKNTVMILGTEYTIETHKVSEDKILEDNNYSGYCAEETKRIVVADMSEAKYFNLDKNEQEIYRKRVLRHEIIHAFLNESGLSDDASTPAGAWAKHEEMVDWIAIQFPKIADVYQELGIMQ